MLLSDPAMFLGPIRGPAPIRRRGGRERRGDGRLPEGVPFAGPRRAGCVPPRGPYPGPCDGRVGFAVWGKV